MAQLRIDSFRADHLDDAALLLSERHSSHLAREPLLASDLDPADELADLFEDATGTVATDGGEVVGFLLGRRLEEGGFGRHVRCDVAGHAVRRPDVTQDLYAVAAESWVADGFKRHVVYVPAQSALVEPWFRLCFGASGAYGACETRPSSASVTPDITVRPSTPDDLHAVVELAYAMHHHLQGSPSFSEAPALGREHFRIWAEVWEDPDCAHFVAERGGEIVGHLLLSLQPRRSLRVPSDSIELTSAATDPAARGCGVGVALTEAALAWAHERGFSAMITDWRMPNLLASRFWPRRGFRETFLRLYREVPGRAGEEI